MSVSLNLRKLLLNTYLCKSNASNVECERLVKDSTASLLLDTQLLLNTSNLDIIFVKSNEEDTKTLVKSGVYEGGLVIWESNWHFLKFLQSQILNAAKGRVLDLGCGCGCLGILAYLKGYSVCFQDMNREVLERYVISNFIINCWLMKLKESNQAINVSLDEICRLDNITLEYSIANDFNDCTILIDEVIDKMAGSGWISDDFCNKGGKNSIGLTCSTWDRLVSDAQNEITFDYIVSSETLYRIEEYNNMVNILEMHLSVSGIAYFATKRFYFGIGGGTFEFIDYIQKNSSTLKAEVVYNYNQISSTNIIDIIKIVKHAS